MDNRTLDELKLDHDDNFEIVMKKAQLREFMSIEHARAYRGAMMTNCLKSLGIDVATVFDLTSGEEAASQRIDQLLLENKVVIENRRETEGRPSWERGIYIYKSGELAYFISIIFPRNDHFTVRSNAPEDIV